MDPGWRPTPDGAAPDLRGSAVVVTHLSVTAMSASGRDWQPVQRLVGEETAPDAGQPEGETLQLLAMQFREDFEQFRPRRSELDPHDTMVRGIADAGD